MKPFTELRVVGFDPSLRNWGVARGVLRLGEEPSLEVDEIRVISPILPKSKQVRQNSQDLEAANQLCKGALKAIEDAQAVFVEVPVGSQSARAMASYGVCVGVLGALRAAGKPFFEVTPTEVKIAACGYKNATKQDMIGWAIKLHPEAPWPTYSEKGVQLLTESKAEHMADAIATIYAGVQTNAFQQLKLFL